MNIVDVIRQGVEERGGEGTALDDGRQKLSYSELLKAADRLADTLQNQGVDKQNRIVLLCRDGIDYIISSLAILQLSAVLVPVHSSAGKEDVRDVCKRIGADFLLFDETLYDTGKDSTSLLPPSTGGISLSLKKLNGQLDIPEDFAELNAAFMRFSSGTTGDSKGVLLTHEAIEARTAAANKALHISEDDTVIWVLAMSYHFVVSILLYLRVGATIRLCSDGQADTLVSALLEGNATFLYAAPFHYFKLSTTPDLEADRLKNLRMAISTSMKLPRETGEQFFRKFGIKPVEAYGIIEVGLPFIDDSSSSELGSVGRILPDYELKLHDPNEDGIGEIWLRGKGMFSGYVSPWKRFYAETEWFHTGDLGQLDNNGILSIVGRTKNLINFLGMKIFPYEVEAVLNRHPAVQESLVYGEDHARYGQIPCAKVVLAEDVTPQALQDFCRQHLMAHEVPMEIRIVERLDRTQSGKLDRKPRGETE